jgi:hypothetical protein
MKISRDKIKKFLGDSEELQDMVVTSGREGGRDVLRFRLHGAKDRMAIYLWELREGCICVGEVYQRLCEMREENEKS